MRRRGLGADLGLAVAGGAVVAAIAAALCGSTAVPSHQGGPGAARSAAAGIVAPAAPAGDPASGPQAATSTRRCPGGGLDWTSRRYSVVPVDPAAGEWLVQEQGTVANTSAWPIVVGNGVTRIGRTDPAGQGPAAELDLPLTPLGSLVLGAGQHEPFSGTILVQSGEQPRDLGQGLSDSGWESPSLAAGCPPPAGAVGTASLA